MLADDIVGLCVGPISVDVFLEDLMHYSEFLTPDDQPPSDVVFPPSTKIVTEKYKPFVSSDSPAIVMMPRSPNTDFYFHLTLCSSTSLISTRSALVFAGISYHMAREMASAQNIVHRTERLTSFLMKTRQEVIIKTQANCMIGVATR